MKYYLLLITACLTFTCAHATSKNLVSNGGFEKLDSNGLPEDWSRLPDTWSVDNEISNSGTKSLMVNNVHAGVYKYPSQTIPCTPGRSYRVGVWIKTENISKYRTGNGATFCVEYFDKGGKYLFGEYGAQKISGTVDWQEVVFEEVLLPERFMMKDVAPYVTLSLYLSKGTTGKAWFDDVAFVENQEPLMGTFLLKPNYRGMILTSAGSPEIRLEVNLNPKPYGMSLKDLEIKCLLRSGEQIIAKKHISKPNSNKFALEMDLDNTLSKGKYTLTTTLLKKDSPTPLARSEYTVEKLSPEDMDTLTSYIDSHNRLIVNGEPFFPLGFYMGHDGVPWETWRLDRIAELNSPFNTIMNYGTLAVLGYDGVTDGITRKKAYKSIHKYLDDVQERNLKLIFAIQVENITAHHNQEAKVKEIISEFRDRPSVISWYINDERGLEWLPKLTQHYTWITEVDQSHPTWSVLWRPQNLIKEVGVTDVLGVDPYPIPKLPATYVAEVAEAAQEASRGTRPLWIAIQAFQHSGKRPPTKDEIRCMTYLGIIHGATGLIYYSYSDLLRLPDVGWEWMKYIGSEIKILEPVILSTLKIPENTLSCNNRSIHFLLKRHRDEFYLIAANTSDSEIKATFKGHGEMQSSSTVEEIFQGEEIPVNDNKLTDTFSPLEVRVYRWPANLGDVSITSEEMFVEVSQNHNPVLRQ